MVPLFFFDAPPWGGKKGSEETDDGSGGKMRDGAEDMGMNSPRLSGKGG